MVFRCDWNPQSMVDLDGIGSLGPVKKNYQILQNSRNVTVKPKNIWQDNTTLATSPKT